MRMKGRQTILGVCCTRCMLHSAYAALAVNSWWWHGEIERDDLTLCSCNDGRVVDEKERDGGWIWERYGGYERTWEIRVMTHLSGFWRPRIGDITRWIATRICPIGDGKLTCSWNSVKSQFLMMISPISSDLSHSCAQLYHHLRTQSWVIPLYLSMPWSWLNTEYTIHQVQHHPKIDSLPLTASFLLPPSFPSLSGCCCTQLSTIPQLQVNQWIESQLPSRLPPDRPLRSAPPISLDYSLQVHLQTRLIMVSQCISEFTRSRSPIASPTSLDHGLPVHLWVHSISVSNPISNVAESRTPSASPNSLHHSLQVHLSVSSISATECISQHTRSRPPSTSLMIGDGFTQIQGYWR